MASLNERAQLLGNIFLLIYLGFYGVGYRNGIGYLQRLWLRDRKAQSLARLLSLPSVRPCQPDEPVACPADLSQQKHPENQYQTKTRFRALSTASLAKANSIVLRRATVRYNTRSASVSIRIK